MKNILPYNLFMINEEEQPGQESDMKGATASAQKPMTPQQEREAKKKAEEEAKQNKKGKIGAVKALIKQGLGKAIAGLKPGQKPPTRDYSEPRP